MCLHVCFRPGGSLSVKEGNHTMDNSTGSIANVDL